MKLQHTPGPWESCDRGDYGDFDGMSQVILGNDMRICVAHSSDKEGEANARLIAAAPEMISELIKIFNTLYNTQPECYWMPIKDVIEKATGMSIEEVLK